MCSYIHGRSEVDVLGTLTKLEYLNLSSEYCHIKRLPEALGIFSNLKYLNLSGFQQLEELPTSFGNIRSLMHLDLSHCSAVKGIPEAMGSLTSLQFLNLSECHNIFENDLDIETKVEAISNLNKLQYLNLSKLGDEHKTSTFESFLDCMKTLSNLEHLDLSGNEILTSLPDCFSRLRKLHTLDLSWCTNLQTIPASIGQTDSLKYIHNIGCPFLKLSTVFHLNKGLVALPHFMVHLNDDSSCSNIVQLKDVNIPMLEISSLENVRSVKEVQIIRLVEKQRVKRLILEWTKDSERSVEDVEVLGELIPPRTLMMLDIAGYNGSKFPDWIMGMASYLPNLVRMNLTGIPNCISLPPLGQLPNLEELSLEQMRSIVKIDGGLCGGPRPFPRLKGFYLRYMKNLEIWNTTYSCSGEGMSEFMFPSLCEVHIDCCPKLRLTPCPPITEKWVIAESDGVMSSWEESVLGTTVAFCSLPAVTAMDVRRCNVPMREWRLLHHLSSIEVLCIRDFSDLAISAETIQALSSLQSLRLDNYRWKVVKLPDWLGHLTSLKELEICCYEVEASLESIKHLTSLKKLSLSDCEAMTTLPHSMEDLTSLEELTIVSCPDLIDFPEGMGRLTSLNKLEIRHCESIKSLPNGIENLTRLAYIRIIGCPELQHWYELEGNKKKLANVEKLV
uniref:NB-ARC domain-containing protein n=1 Tax=Oryza brachyantha TaxID=4533 RepID=J3N6T3_ORYBR